MTTLLGGPAVTPETALERSAPKKSLLVDTDLHPVFIASRDIAPRLDERWREHIRNLPPSGSSGVPRMVGKRSMRGDASPNGIVAGSDLDLLREQVLDLYDVDYGIVVPFYGNAPLGPPEFDAAYHHAVNLWQREDLIDRDRRLRGSIRIPFEYPDRAIAEIERWASDPDFVQVQITNNPQREWGDKLYWPIYEAVEAAGLPIMAHVGSPRGYNEYNGAGSPSYYVEQHIYVQFIIERIAISLISAGVFEAFPGLNLVLLESCIAWAGPLKWSMDTLYEKTKGALPALKARPSEYFEHHVYFSTQPIEEPVDPTELTTMYELSHMVDHIMFSTDYPHWDFDAPDRALPTSMPRPMRDKIMGLNAAKLYGLETGATPTT